MQIAVRCLQWQDMNHTIFDDGFCGHFLESPVSPCAGHAQGAVLPEKQCVTLLRASVAFL